MFGWLGMGGKLWVNNETVEEEKEEQRYFLLGGNLPFLYWATCPPDLVPLKGNMKLKWDAARCMVFHNTRASNNFKIMYCISKSSITIWNDFMKVIYEIFAYFWICMIQRRKLFPQAVFLMKMISTLSNLFLNPVVGWSYWRYLGEIWKAKFWWAQRSGLDEERVFS